MEGLLLFGVALAGAVWVTLRPEWGAPYFAGLVYLRLSDALRGEFGVPSLFKIVAPWLLVAALGRWLLTGAEPGRGWRSALWLLTAYGAVCLGSLLFASDRESTRLALMNYLDGVFIVLVMALYLRSALDLERTLWAVLLAATTLASLSVFQQLSGSYDSTFAGLAHVELRNLVDETSGYRSEGPVAANYFALILVVAIPLAVDRLLHEPRRQTRWLAAGCLASLLTALFYTYSRGGIVSLAAVALPMLVWVPRRQLGRLLVVGGAAAALLLVLVAPTSYGQRLAALGQVAGILRGETPGDSALRGRLSEVTSAAMMFSEHVVVGVGYGNFESHYHRYAQDLGLDGRRGERQAHSLYLEVAAETGLVGILVFGMLLAGALAGLRSAYLELLRREQSLAAQRVLAFGIALFGYLAGSVFLHLSYPRYFWLLLGIAFGAAALASRERLPQLATSAEVTA